ncbi:MAG: biotin--[acetyl-CoA-carboxylase] ligase [candidate division WOR-3 bacterium]|nr:biotin--[acetyl-CoA-carboxylase] ligase [candidate division WOR-3 bacterium]
MKFKRVTSTQDVVKRLINNKKEIAVFAHQQTKGRGRYKREWFSPPGGMYLSILVFPKRHVNLIPVVSCVAVIETLKDLHFDNLSIHWPNDVLLNQKKICGILCERIDDAVICGIGLNVNIKKFPSRLSCATSLYKEAGKIYRIRTILNLCLKNFWNLYDSLQENKFNLHDVYHYIGGVGEPVEIKLSSKEVIKGIIHNVDEDWSLVVRTDDGLIKKIYQGDVIRVS